MERRVRTRLGVSGSNSVVHISLKILLLPSRGACVGGRLSEIFFILLFSFFVIFYFLEIYL